MQLNFYYVCCADCCRFFEKCFAYQNLFPNFSFIAHASYSRDIGLLLLVFVESLGKQLI